MEFFGSVAGRLAAVGRELLVQALAVYATLLKVMLPALLVVKALDMAGATGWLAVLLSPSMQLVGLPDAMGLVWATAMLTNLYTAIAVYAGFAAQEPLTVAQATVLGTMMLVSHSLPVEGAGVLDPCGLPVTLTNNYIDAALTEVLAGKPVTVSETKPYGCSVKFAPEETKTEEKSKN